MPEWAREQRKRAEDREPAEQNDCCAVKLICMIKGSLIATLSCGVLIIRYRIIKGHATTLLWLDWYTLDFLGGTDLELFAATTPSVKPICWRHTLAFPLKRLHVFLFLVNFLAHGWDRIEWTEGVKGKKKKAIFYSFFAFFTSLSSSFPSFPSSLLILVPLISFFRLYFYLTHKKKPFTTACH